MSTESLRLDAVELRRIALPLVTPFRTSFGTQTARDVLLVRAFTSVGDGWGECVAMDEPLYSPEYADGAEHVLRHHLLPRLFGLPLTAASVGELLAPVHGHPMAKAAIEMAVLDAELRAAGMSLARHLGATADRVPSGVSIGIHDTDDDLLRAVGGYLDDGYVRIKLKIEPGADIERVRVVRRAIGDDVPLQVDANTAYTRADIGHLARLDEFGLLLIEQPLPEDDLIGHAQLAAAIATPVCLDESVVSARSASDAIAIGATSVINIKAGRVGGYVEARRVHDVARAAGVPVWCGGMLETGIGRAANAALAALPGFTLPGDLSASARFWEHDIVTRPITVDDGHIAVPTGPGLGVEVDLDRLDAVTTSATTIEAGSIVRP